MPLGKPSVSDPRTLDLRALQTAVSNIRQRLEAIEAATLALQSAPASTSTTTTSSSGTGTVSRVAATVPDFLTVSGTPITISGTLAFALATQQQGHVFAGPVSGADAAPTFRALQWSFDLPLYSTESFTSGLTGDEIVLIERYGEFVWTTVRDIANGGGGGGGVDVQAIVSASTVTPTFSNDLVKVTALAVDTTLANPSGSAVDGWGMVIRLKDNGTSRTITYGSQYRAVGVTLPTATTVSKVTYLAMIYNNDETKWDVLAVGTQA